MYLKNKRLWFICIPIIFFILSAILINYKTYGKDLNKQADISANSDYIKWLEFKITFPALEDTMNVDIKSVQEGKKINWIDLLAILGSKYCGDFSKYKRSDLNNLVDKIKETENMEDITSKLKNYDYYKEAYGTVLAQFVGPYKIEVNKEVDTDAKIFEEKYGLKAFSPIAKTYPYEHYDDFGASRSYGFSRPHLGHDLMSATGTPVIAVESGTVEAMGWNQYGGWRIGIRSFDKKRYYYYAHLRQNRPYHVDLCEGKVVKAGDVIGYVGRTGYSSKENANNINKSHLHFGLQIIFDESQKDGNNEIWIDLYHITKLLEKNRSEVYRVSETKEFYRKYDFLEEGL